MIRKVVTPDKKNISIEVPENYLGKQLEVIAFTIEESTEENFPSDKPLTHFASEKLLGKDWLSSEEDKAWQNL